MWRQSVHVGEPEIHQDDVRQVLGRECDARGTCRFERSEPPARSTSRSLRFFSLSSTIRTSGCSASVDPPPGDLETEPSPSYPAPVPIRLVLADDHYLVREGVRRLLETQPDIEVAAVCGDLDSLLAAVDAERPDVVVTDIRMPPGDTDEGIQAAARRATNPEVGVVVLSQYANPSICSLFWRAAARGVRTS